MAKQRGERPCAEGPVKHAHLCEIDARTKIGTEAWYRLNSKGAQRVDVNRGLHAVGQNHGGAQAVLAKVSRAKSMATAHTRTMVRAMEKARKK